MLPHLFLIFIILNLIDWGITSKLISMGANELNPIMVFAYSHGIILPLLIKIVGIILIFHTAKWLSERNWRASFFTLLFLDLVFTAIVLNNFYWYIVLR